MNLAEGSKSYHEEADIYERFSEVEDTPGHVLNFLRTIVKGKDVLDLGCGTGKYLVPLSLLAKSYCGLDISADQLRIARMKARDVDLICSSAEEIGLGDNAVDVTISTWVFGTILDDKRRMKALEEAERVTRKSIYLVENDIGGEFEYVRGRYPDIRQTKRYNDWLMAHGFRPIERIDSLFEFKHKGEAKRVIEAIWGKGSASKIKGRKIAHKIIIYRKEVLK